MNHSEKTPPRDSEILKKEHNEMLRIEYKEVSQSHRAITDFRGKLLALLPIATGTGLFLLLKTDYAATNASHFAAVGLFGFLATLGLFFHELHGIDDCWELVKRGKDLEIKMNVDPAEDRDRKQARAEGQFGVLFDKEKDNGWFHRVIGPEGAAWIIYMTTMWAWLYLFVIGLSIEVLTNIWCFRLLMGTIWFLMVPIGLWLYLGCGKDKVSEQTDSHAA
jgi:hypothetical protein